MDTFYSLYPVIKHAHLGLIACSVLFFIVRFGLSLAESKLLDIKLVKIAPHIIDTFLLLSGLLLCVQIQQYPFVDPWLTEKIGAVFAYVLLGMMAFRRDRNKLFRFFAFFGALGWLVLAAKLAMVKHTIFLG
ncbi:SirB2 family protein [Shewanella marina]|uniref:SirB2 family protein n=1 Tax=Shewanella marina TaxID=487319 RepID=UPI0004724024|nr:SirB2 family protein [Shewanella marina]